MPNWSEILHELQQGQHLHDLVRRRYVAELSKLTGRNTIIYYSGWLQKGQLQGAGCDFSINDADKNGFMTCIHGLDRRNGLDLLLHSPGGETAATESLVDYLRSMFETNIRAIIPQIAMSAATLIALACKEIVMGKQSSIGPIDPQFGPFPAHGVIEEFKRAAEEIEHNEARIALWGPIISQYYPTLIGECEKSIKWADELAKDWLCSGMFEGRKDAASRADKVVAELASHALTLSHSRHISLEKAKEIGLVVLPLEDHKALQDAVLSVHHACIHTLIGTAAFKMIENQNSVSYIDQIQVGRA